MDEFRTEQLYVIVPILLEVSGDSPLAKVLLEQEAVSYVVSVVIMSSEGPWYVIQ